MGLRTPAQTALEFPGTQQRRLQATQGLQTMAAPQALAQQPGGLAAAGPRALAQAGAQAGAAQQQAVTQAVQQGAQEQQQAAQDQLAIQQAQQQDSMRMLKRQVAAQGRELASMMQTDANLAEDELFTQQLRFQQDELGQTMLNERQLADYALNAAKTQEELADYEQEVNLALERKQLLLKRSFDILRQAEEQLFQSEQTEANQELTLKIAQAKQKLEEDMQRLAKDAANKAAIWSAVSTVGAAVTPLYPPAGLAITAVGAVGGAAQARESQKAAEERQAQGAQI
jgi:hypothetical protein